MKLKTSSQFTDVINKNLAHRKRELSALLHLVGRCRNHELEVLSKSAVCLLYGHWEGFVKFGGTCLANYVHFNGVAIPDLSNGFIAACVQQKLKEVRGSKKISLSRELVEMIRHPNVGLGSLSWDKVVQTHDNLNLDTLKEILEIVGCDISFYETKKGIINEQLVHYRNSIAHTGFSEFNSDDYDQLHKDVLEIIEQFRDDLENSVSSRWFAMT